MDKEKARAIAAALALIMVLASCTKTHNVGERDTLVVISQVAPFSLDPAKTNDSASAQIMKQIYETLFNQNYQTMIAMPSLAERHAFETNAEGQPVYLRLFIKQGVLFHNGRELKAGDVKFSLERAMESPYTMHIVDAVGSVDVVGDYEVLITLKYPFAPILNHLAHTALSIVNEKAVHDGGSEYARHPVGTGPLQFVNWVAGNRIELRRWDKFHGNPARIKNITVRYITDPATAVLELETGGGDLYLHLDNQPQDVSRIEANPDINVFKAQSLRINYMGFNFRKPPFNDIRVRKAILHAIDIDVLVNNVWQGIGSSGRGPISSRVWASAASQLEQYEYDVEKARQLLSEAGYPDGFSTSLSVNEAQDRVDAATIINNMLAQVGIRVDLNVMEWATYMDYTSNGEHDLFILGWTTVTGDPNYGLELFHTRAFGSAGNTNFYSNRTVDQLLDRGRTETDTAKREEIYLEAQRIIHSEAPWLYLFEGEYVIGARKGVSGFEISPAGHHPLWNVYFE